MKLMLLPKLKTWYSSFGLVDTNGDPESVDYMIPCNDDATKTVHLMLQIIADAIVEARGGITVVAHMADDAAGAENIDDAMKKIQVPKQRPSRRL